MLWNVIDSADKPLRDYFWHKGEEVLLRVRRPVIENPQVRLDGNSLDTARL